MDYQRQRQQKFQHKHRYSDIGGSFTETIDATAFPGMSFEAKDNRARALLSRLLRNPYSLVTKQLYLDLKNSLKSV